MKIRITTKSVLELPLSLKQVDALIALSRHHYDARCRMASKEDGGFLARWRRMIEGSLACGMIDGTVPASMQQADTCLKILEMRHAIAALVDSDIWEQLNRDLWGATQLANSKYAEWQATYERKE